MNAPPTQKNLTKPLLYGPSVQYSSGKVVAGYPLDVEQILSDFERLDADARSAFLCTFAHDLTVDIRVCLVDRPVSDADLDRVEQINESLHQLTSCVNPHKRWSPRDEVLLIRAIIEGSFQHGVDRAVGRALATAAGNTITAKKSIAAK